jgi:outer membrane protein TolC
MLKVSSAGKTANLEINKAQAGLMAARGAFDPKLQLTLTKTIQRH